MHCTPRLAVGPRHQKGAGRLFPPTGSLPGFYLAIPSKSLYKQYGFLTFFRGKVNFQHISNSRALLFFRRGCRGSALCWAGLRTPLRSLRSENMGREE